MIHLGSIHPDVHSLHTPPDPDPLVPLNRTASVVPCIHMGVLGLILSSLKRFLEYRVPLLMEMELNPQLLPARAPEHLEMRLYWCPAPLERAGSTSLCSASRLHPHTWPAGWLRVSRAHLPPADNQSNHNLRRTSSVRTSCVPARVAVRSRTLISAFCTFYPQAK